MIIYVTELFPSQPNQNIIILAVREKFKLTISPFLVMNQDVLSSASLYAQEVMCYILGDCSWQ